MGLGHYINLMREKMERTSSAARAELCFTAPKITDLRKMRGLYLRFKEVSASLSPEGGRWHMERRKFLLIAAYFFSPRSLVGEKMRQGVREAMSEVTGITPQLVCRQFRQALFYYRTYSDFRKSVDAILEGILAGE